MPKSPYLKWQLYSYFLFNPTFYILFFSILVLPCETLCVSIFNFFCIDTSISEYRLHGSNIRFLVCFFFLFLHFKSYLVKYRSSINIYFKNKQICKWHKHWYLVRDARSYVSFQVELYNIFIWESFCLFISIYLNSSFFLFLFFQPTHMDLQLIFIPTISNNSEKIFEDEKLWLQSLCLQTNEEKGKKMMH